jgi:hypothetical protein
VPTVPNGVAMSAPTPADLIDRLAEAVRKSGWASSHTVARAVLDALRRESPEVVAEVLGLTAVIVPVVHTETEQEARGVPQFTHEARIVRKEKPHE